MSTSSRSSNYSAAADPGQPKTGIMEAPDLSDTVVLPAEICHLHRPGPVVGVGNGVFQPAMTGKYNCIVEHPVPDYSSCSSTNNIWVYYQNVRGLRTKIDEVYLATEDNMYDVIILTETGLDDRINSVQLFGSSYTVFRCDRSHLNSEKRSFGGVLLAVAKQHQCDLFEPAHGRNLEQICVSVTIHALKLLFSAIYTTRQKQRCGYHRSAHCLRS